MLTTARPLRWLLVIAFIGFALLAFGGFQPVQARSSDRAPLAQTPAPTAIIDPLMATLQAQVQAQATQAAVKEQELNNKIDRVQLDVQQTYLPWTIVGLVAAALGIPLSAGLAYKYARDKAKKMIDKAIYQIDPVNAIVHLPADFAQGQDYLKWRGFYKFRPYQTLDNTCVEDCVVLVANQLEDFDEFRAFLKKYSPNPKKAAYVIYTQLSGPRDIVNDFPNITYANSLITLGTNLFTVARSLIRP